ncbi:TIGR01244 family sulfur transferase [uncultured Roseobacter sp.]|uniref:TIGR01244 family sulfur transferase n=1 Tax=uncultured Roseobacter sp. TaxID=114847 RepID=UPI002617EC80|nr:TIGR01244 family sulfur transferase [uncultured Roseobacter sp.]
MDIRQLTPGFFVAPQIAPEDMERLAALGISLVICNRPDEEVPPSHQCEAMREAAERAGLAFAVQPLTHQTMTPPVIAANRALIDGTDDTVLAYCASGTRSTVAWALGVAGDLDPDAIITAAQSAGYDLRNMKPTLEAIAAQQS